MKPKPTSIVFLTLALLSLGPHARAQNSAFTYQGRLDSGGVPASGLYDFRFRLASDPFANNYVDGSVLTNGVPVMNGLFAVAVDFGPGIFTGSNYWLEVDVRTNGAGFYAALNPLQPLTPAPYAVFANTASNLTGALPSSLLSGAYGNAVTFNNPSNSFSGSYVGDGGNLTNITAATVGGLAASAIWSLNGNAVAPGQFLGSTNNQPLELRVNGLRGLQLTATANGAFQSNVINVVNGSPANFVAPGVSAATIGGGGAQTYGSAIPSNSIASSIGTVAGGVGNTIQLDASVATIGGGQLNTIQTNSFNTTIAGGYDNVIGSAYATISGGAYHTVGTNSNSGTISGGYNHAIGNNSFDGAIGGGSYHSIGTNSYYATVAGGRVNTIGDNSTSSTIAGGQNNFIYYSGYAAVGGGFNNQILQNCAYSVVSGGQNNSIQSTAPYSAINGGQANSIGVIASGSSIGGGISNAIQSDAYDSAISGGIGNIIQSGAYDSAIGGGSSNVIGAGAYNTAIGGGVGNVIQTIAQNSVIGGGYYNTIQTNAHEAAIAGGSQNVIGAYDLNGFIGAGWLNAVLSGYGSVVGGWANTNGSFASVISGGTFNAIQANGQGSCISGGEFNTIASNITAAAIGGGSGNVSGSNYATVPGGYQNVAAGQYSFAAGNRAKANYDGDFVWADSQGADFASTAPDQFMVRARGGIQLVGNTQLAGDTQVTGNTQMAGDVALVGGYRNLNLSGGNAGGYLYGSYPKWGDGIHMGYNYYADASGADHISNPGGGTSRITAGYGEIVLAVGGVNSAPVTTMLHVTTAGVCANGPVSNCSDRNVKQDFAPVSPSQILDKVTQLPVSEWSYKLDTATRHIGPMAQDFYAAFNVGMDDKHIATVDEEGVALAAIQGLNQKLQAELAAQKQWAEAKNADIEALKARNDALEKRLDALERLLPRETARAGATHRPTD